MEKEGKTRIALSCVTLAICVAFLCLGLFGGLGKTSVWIFGGLTLYNAVVIVLMIMHLKKKNNNQQ